ncbi:aspartate 1-decarboxylase [Flavobacteriaceae bacterium Ap0902]|nr:aspartate 1-decarboxylase [Flavobacteriaceae bacterium Ap0902]
MLIQVFKSKIHRIKVTGAELNYIGSITLDPILIDAAGITVGERVQIVNINNGERIETYVIKGEKGSGDCILNGPAARRVAKGDLVIIIGYAYMTPEEAEVFQPKIVFPNEETNLLE